MTEVLQVSERGRILEFSFADMLKYHGPLAPGGVAHSFKVMQRAFPLLSPDGPIARREIRIDTSFGGPGARDGFEMVTRAVSDGRFEVDPALARPERGTTLERYVFRLGYRDQTVTLAIREGLVRDEYIDLSRRPDLTVDEEARLTVLKQEMADRIMAAPADEVYDPENTPLH